MAEDGIRIDADQAGIVVTVDLVVPGSARPTRYHLSLRRQRANAWRRSNGKPTLPAITAGSCEPCDGWGVVGQGRASCTACGGTGDA
jgi:hypothetical protein